MTVRIEGVELAPKQGDAYLLLRDSVTTDVTFGGGANGGKSWLGSFWLIEMCYSYPGTKYYIGREELKRLRETTLITFHKVCKTYGALDFTYNGQDHFLKHKNGSRIDLLDLKFLPSDPLYERYGSSEYTSGWIEEGGETYFGAYDVLKSRVGRWMNDEYGLLRKQLITTNPKKGWLKRLFYDPHRSGSLPDGKAFIQSLVNDNLFRESGSVEALESIEDEATKQRLLYGNWDYEDEPDQLIKYEWVEACRSAPLVKYKKTMGVDVARYGDDVSCFAYMTGNGLYKVDTHKHKSTDTIAEYMILGAIGEDVDGDRIAIDGVGLGAGVIDQARRSGYKKVIDIQSGAKVPRYEEFKHWNFNNLRSFMWWLMREDLRNGRLHIGPDIKDSLVEDITAPKYSVVKDREIVVESKDGIKKRLGRSTDEGDAFVYTNYLRWVNLNKRPSRTSASPSKAGVFLP